VTTIAYRDGVLAADSLVTEGNRRVGMVTKVFAKNGVVAACAGCLAHMHAFRDWFLNGMSGDPPSLLNGDSESDAIIIYRGRVVTWSKLGWDMMRSDFYAIGSGAGPALGAMAAGATAEQAVVAAITLDVWSGGDITVLRAEV
jgi:ATP-dependent protease HslVU (ClpYQ) peptidase subunit